MPRNRHTIITAAAVGLLLGSAAAQAQERTQERPGRYVMNPVEGGFARLDTETGAMAVCKPQAGTPAAWSCQPMADAAVDTQAQARRLETENKDLRAEVKRMEDLLGLNGQKPKGDEKQAEERPGGRGLALPSEREIDQALSYMERMVRKFHDTMKRIEGDKKSTPL
jgi:hypothetical protein